MITTAAWTFGETFVQGHKHSAHNASIQSSPYEAMFGCTVKVGLTSTSMPTEVTGNLHSEDLLALVAPNQVSDNKESSQQPTSTSTHLHTSTSMQPATQPSMQTGQQAQEEGVTHVLPVTSSATMTGDPRNIPGLISCHNPDKDLYKISVGGVLKGHFSRNHFQLCPQKLLTEADARQDQALSLREAVTKQSRCGGQ